MGTDLDAALTTPAGETRCKRHPDVETGLLCGRCDTPICPRCLVQTPVGARCPECANVSRIPTVDVKPVFLLRGAAAALLAGMALGAAWAFVLGRGGFIGFFSIFLGMGLGWAIAESISVATNRKRGRALQACAVFSAVIALLVRNLLLDGTLLVQGDLSGYIVAGVAAFYASSRLNY